MVPGSTLRYGSHFCRVTLKPRLSRRQPMEEAATPFPSEETTPPVTKIYFGAIRDGPRTQSRTYPPSAGDVQGIMDAGAKSVKRYRHPRATLKSHSLSTLRKIKMSANVPPGPHSKQRKKERKSQLRVVFETNALYVSPNSVGSASDLVRQGIVSAI